MQAVTPFVLIWLTTSSKEREIINCLQKNNVCHDPAHTRNELLTLTHMVKPMSKCYKLDETASSTGLTVMPPTTVQQSSFGPKLSIVMCISDYRRGLD
jgi:hypothetical protein